MPGWRRTGAFLAGCGVALGLLGACGTSPASNSLVHSTSTISPGRHVNAVSAFESYWTTVDDATEVAINPSATDETDAMAYGRYLANLKAYKWPGKTASGMKALESDVSALISAFRESSTHGDEYETPQLGTAEADEANSEGQVEYTLGIHSDRSQPFFATTSTS